MVFLSQKGGSYVCKLAVCALRTSTIPHPHIGRRLSLCEKWVASAVQNSVRCETPKQMVVFNIYAQRILNLVVKRLNNFLFFFLLTNKFISKTKRNWKFQFKIEKHVDAIGAFFWSVISEQIKNIQKSCISRQILCDDHIQYLIVITKLLLNGDTNQTKSDYVILNRKCALSFRPFLSSFFFCFLFCDLIFRFSYNKVIHEWSTREGTQTNQGFNITKSIN